MQNLTTNFGLVGQMVGDLETLDDTPEHRENLRLQIEVVEEISRRVQLLLLEASVQFSGEGKRIQARYKETVRCFKSLREKADAMMARSPPNTASRPPSSAAPPHNRSNSTGGLAKDRIRQSLHHSGTMLYNSIAEAVAQGPSYPQKPSATNQATVSSHKRRAPAKKLRPPYSIRCRKRRSFGRQLCRLRSSGKRDGGLDQAICKQFNSRKSNDETNRNR